MNVKKVIGYLLLIAGVLGIIISYQQARDFLNIALPESITEIYVLTIGVILAIIGALLAFKKSKTTAAQQELPIYQGKGKNRQIVGYQRH